MGAELVELVADSWPPAVEERHGAWRFRWAWGLTRRANSVLAIDDGGPIDDRVQAAEGWYAARESPTRFQVSTASAPAGLGPLLEARGYRADAPTLVQVATPRLTSSAAEVRDEPWDQWLEAYFQSGRDALDAADQERYRNTLLRTELPSAFVLVSLDGSPAGVGQAVAGVSVVNVQCMATVPECRGRGVAGKVLAAIGTWAADRGACQLVLAVDESNKVAERVYGRAGFTTVHRYVYWTR